MRHAMPVFAAALLIGATACPQGFTPGPSGPVMLNNSPVVVAPAGSNEVFVSMPSGALIEGGVPVTASVSLKLPPMADVTVTLTSSDETAATVEPASLVFTAQDFSMPQTISITPVDDEVADGVQPVEIGFALSSEDPNFEGKPVNPLVLEVVDNDVAPEIVISPVGPPEVAEDGGMLMLSVQLNRQPDSEVLVPIATSDEGQGFPDLTTLTFTTLDWNLPQTVTVTGVDDLQQDVGTMFSITFGPTNSADEAFNAIGPASIDLLSVDGTCGNGVVDGDEVCEPDPEGAPDCEFGVEVCPEVCTNACVLVRPDSKGFCGDGMVQAEGGEECDAPTEPCAYGEESCTTCSGECKEIPGRLTGFCGDGVVQGANGEACDGPAEPCQYGQMSCETCDQATCQKIAGEVVGFCGDGVIQGDDGEECDGPLDPADVQQACGVTGTLSCGSDCKYEGDCLTYANFANGDGFSCGVRSDASTVCWGQAPSGVPAVATLVAADLDTACFDEGTQVTCVGGFATTVPQGVDEMDLEVGSAGDYLCVRRSSQVTCLTSANDPTFTNQIPSLSFGAKSLAVGDGFGCILPSNNFFGPDVECWGAAAPTNLPTGDFAALAADGSELCALRESGSVHCVGGALPSFTSLSGGFRAFTDLDIYSGTFSSYGCAVGVNGGMECFGSVPNGVPATVNGAITDISVSQDHVCARGLAGDVVCWGSNSNGQTTVP